MRGDWPGWDRFLELGIVELGTVELGTAELDLAIRRAVL
jgi:hypothetical protein